MSRDQTYVLKQNTTSILKWSGIFFPVLGSQAEIVVDHPRFPNTLKTHTLHYLVERKSY